MNQQRVPREIAHRQRFLDKSDGFVVLTSEGAQAFLDSLPVGRIPGVGKAGQKALAELGVQTIEDLGRIPAQVLLSKFGAWGHTLTERAHGRDESEVVPDSQAKSIGRETTLQRDVEDVETLAEVLGGLTENVGRRLRRQQLKAKTVTVKVRFADFATSTRSKTLAEATSSDKVLSETALACLAKGLGRGHRPVRLVGVSATGISPAVFAQLALFPDAAERAQGRLDGTIDRIRERFGDASIRRGRRGAAQRG